MELSKEKLDEIKAEIDKSYPLPKRGKAMSDYAWDEIITIAGSQRMCFELGMRAEALKSLSIEKERDELKAERDRYKEALEAISQVKYKSLDLGESWYDRLTDATTIARTALTPIEQVNA